MDFSMSENKIIDGKSVSSEIRDKVKKFGNDLKSKTGKTPGLAVVLVGDNPASRVYVKNKTEKTKEVGFNSIEHKLDEKADYELSLESIYESKLYYGLMRCIENNPHERYYLYI